MTKKEIIKDLEDIKGRLEIYGSKDYGYGHVPLRTFVEGLDRKLDALVRYFKLDYAPPVATELPPTYTKKQNPVTPKPRKKKK